MKKIIAIDPGNKESAFCVWDGSKITSVGKANNHALKSDAYSWTAMFPEGVTVVVEMIASYGMPVGKEVFETCLYIGQLQQMCDHLHIRCDLIYRKDVKMHLCNSMKAKDSNIRQALIDRFGDKGTKKAPGITYGLAADMWSAFALAVYYYDQTKPICDGNS